MHDSWHTVDAALLLQPEKYEASLAAHRNRIATGHEAAIRAEEKLKALVGHKEKHG